MRPHPSPPQKPGLCARASIFLQVLHKFSRGTYTERIRGPNNAQRLNFESALTRVSGRLVDAELRSNYFGLTFGNRGAVFVTGLRETTGESDPNLQDFALYTKKSNNMGQLWRTLDLHSFPGFVGGALNILFDKSRDLWTVGNGWDENGVRRALTRLSRDGGGTWRSVDTYKLSETGNSEIYAIRELESGRKISAGYAVDGQGLRHLIYRLSNQSGLEWETLVDTLGPEGLGAFPQQMVNGKDDSLLTAGGVSCSSPCQRKWAIFKLKL